MQTILDIAKQDSQSHGVTQYSFCTDCEVRVIVMLLLFMWDQVLSIHVQINVQIHFHSL